MASTSCLKIFFYILDILCALLALVLISFGIYIFVSYNPNSIGAVAAYVYIGVGVAGLCIIIWGYLAAWRENVCCSVTFIVLLYIIILVQVTVISLMFISGKDLVSNLANTLDDTWDEELNSPGAMSIYESWFDCCGRASPQDYIVIDRLPPATCFRNQQNEKPENLITVGCRVQFEDYLMHLLLIFNILSCLLIALELIGSFVSCCLCNSIRNDRRRTYY